MEYITNKTLTMDEFLEQLLNEHAPGSFCHDECKRFIQEASGKYQLNVDHWIC